MSNLYNTIIQATIFGSVVGIIIFALKSTVLKKLPAKWQYLLWSVMIIKLIFPNGPESKISMFNQIKIDESIIPVNWYTVWLKITGITVIASILLIIA